MRPWTVIALAAAVVASGAIAQNKEAYSLNAATEDLAVFHRLARDGALKREDVRSDVDFGARFDQVDLDRDGVVTAAEMDRYIAATYGIFSASAGASKTVDSYRRHAATRDLEAFHQLARGGSMRREDAAAHPFVERFDDADANRDGLITAQEMDRYILQSYGIATSRVASRGSGSASIGSGQPASPAGASGNSGSASAGSSRR
jgi:hypothetical protein